LTDDGVILFGEYIANNTSIRHIDFSSCRIKDAGGIQLAQGLKDNTTIKSFNLKDNSLEAEAGLAFAEAIP
jgi:hypothetical protein